MKFLRDFMNQFDTWDVVNLLALAAFLVFFAILCWRVQ